MDYLKKLYREFDFWLLIPVVIIVGFSLVILVNASAAQFTGDEQSLADYVSKMNFSLMKLQALWFGVGLVAMFAVTLLDYDVLSEYSKYAWWVILALLAGLFVLGKTTNGTTGWFKLFNDQTIQPGEFCKVVLILVFARMISKKVDEQGGLVRFRDLWGLFFFFGIPFVLVVIQPDMGTAMVLFVILAGMMFIGKISWKIVLILLVVVVAVLPVAWTLLVGYQQNRLMDFLHPNTNPNQPDQVDYSLMTIGSGQLTGKGLFIPDSYSQSDYLFAKTTDFIFSITVEATGFWGGLILILLYFALLARILYIAVKSRDTEGQLIAAGVFSMFLFHVVENIGMTMKILPVTGIPLPLFSYGGSNMLMNMIAIGLVENVAMRRQRNLIKEG